MVLTWIPLESNEESLCPMNYVQSTHGLHPKLESIVGSNEKIINLNTKTYAFENKLQDMEIKPKKKSQYLYNTSTMISASRYYHYMQ